MISDLIVAAVMLAAPAGEPAPIDVLLAKIKSVGKEGAGNPEAGRAWKQLTARGPDALPAILAAMDDDRLAVSNWLRNAVDAIGERTLRAGGALPTTQLATFIATPTHAGCARRLAYEWLTRVDPATPSRLLPGMLQDLSPELRRDAVALAIKDAAALLKSGDRNKAANAFRRALGGACDQDQVDAIAKELKTLGAPVDLASHFGVIKTWYLTAPFDNTKEAGFAAVYPPEKGVDLKTVYKGKNGMPARWSEHTTDDAYGAVDLNKVLGKQKEAVAYAFAAIDVPAPRLVQVRLGCINAVKLFVNGKQVFAREEYHHGMRLDQYVCTAKLNAGRNELLLKICQNNQTDSWAQDWKFQARLTDFVGAAVRWRPAPVRLSQRTEGQVGP